MKRYDKNIPHIVYASDERFAEILGISLVSLYENSKDMNDIIIYILDSGITVKSKEKIEAVSKTYERSLPVWIIAKNISEELSIDVAFDRGSLSQYARLFISSVLPEHLTRVLYLDCDIIINKSIVELWNLDLHGKTIGALKDAFSKYYRVNIDLQPQDIMFNSGVMLVDLERWKKNKIERKLLYFISEKNGKIQQGDQGALNSILSHETYCFEPCFNSVTIFYDFTYEEMLVYRKPENFYTKEQVKEAVEEPRIIHFTTSFLSQRPWVEGCKHMYCDEWMKYKKLSPWKDKKLWKDTRPLWGKVGNKVFNWLSRRIALSIAGFMQAYGRPIRNRVRK